MAITHQFVPVLARFGFHFNPLGAAIFAIIAILLMVAILKNLKML
jgi:hypothetical protein